MSTFSADRCIEDVVVHLTTPFENVKRVCDRTVTFGQLSDIHLTRCTPLFRLACRTSACSISPFQNIPIGVATFTRWRDRAPRCRATIRQRVREFFPRYRASPFDTLMLFVVIQASPQHLWDLQ